MVADLPSLSPLPPRTSVAGRRRQGQRRWHLRDGKRTARDASSPRGDCAAEGRLRPTPKRERANLWQWGQQQRQHGGPRVAGEWWVGAGCGALSHHHNWTGGEPCYGRAYPSQRAAAARRPTAPRSTSGGGCSGGSGCGGSGRRGARRARGAGGGCASWGGGTLLQVETGFSSRGACISGRGRGTGRWAWGRAGG
jgi:hypothetical protein